MLDTPFVTYTVDNFFKCKIRLNWTSKGLRSDLSSIRRPSCREARPSTWGSPLSRPPRAASASPAATASRKSGSTRRWKNVSVQKDLCFTSSPSKYYTEVTKAGESNVASFFLLHPIRHPLAVCLFLFCKVSVCRRNIKIYRPLFRISFLPFPLFTRPFHCITLTKDRLLCRTAAGKALKLTYVSAILNLLEMSMSTGVT